MLLEIKQKEFCRLTGLTRKALLVYESKQLLIPHRIDHSTGYRFYNNENIEKGLKISFLRSLSFSVQEIFILLEESQSATKLLETKQRELVEESQRVKHGINFIEINDAYPFPFSTDLREMQLPLYRVATIEGRGKARDVSIHHKLLSQQMKEHAVETVRDSGTYFFEDSTLEELHFKVFAPIIQTWVETVVPFAVEQFGIPRFTYMRHYGTYERLHKSYQKLYQQMYELKIDNSGEFIEMYRNSNITRNNHNYTTLLTDIGVPTWI